MRLQLFLKIMALHMMAKSLAFASSDTWAYQQIEAPHAQKLASEREAEIVVAVIDTGMDIHHPDLRHSLWENPGEKGLDRFGKDRSKNGIDDDKNGFVDDLHGWNFVDGSKHVVDQDGHGTHIAGIIAARNLSGFGIQGVAPKSKLMILKYYDAKAPPLENLRKTIQAFRYAIQSKARIINFSGGGPGFSSAEESVLKEAQKKGILVVAAAGNDGINTDSVHYYPADYGLSHILSVTALDQKLNIPSYGNYGIQTVHLAAPGDQILSTLPGGAHGMLSGTSQATAFATGAAALLLSQNPALTPEQAIEKLTSSSVLKASLYGKTRHSSMLNAWRPLVMKSEFESASGFIYENSAEWDPRSFTVSSALLDDRELLRNVGSVSKADSQIPFDPLNPFPLHEIGLYSYPMAKEHAILADKWLGLQTQDTETQIQNPRATDSFPQERWLGLDPQSFSTPYIEIRMILELLSPQPGQKIIDFGCGYGRMAHVVGKHFPLVYFLGYEIVRERIEEAKRCLRPFAYPLIRLEWADLVQIRPEPADFYFMYDFGSKSAIEKTLLDLQEIAKQQSIQVVARGRASRSLIHKNNPWLAEVHEPRHFETFSIYRS